MQLIRNSVDRDTLFTALVVIPAAYVWIYFESAPLALLLAAAAGIAEAVYIHYFVRKFGSHTLENIRAMLADVRHVSAEILISALSRIRGARS